MALDKSNESDAEDIECFERYHNLQAELASIANWRIASIAFQFGQ